MKIVMELKLTMKHSASLEVKEMFQSNQNEFLK